MEQKVIDMLAKLTKDELSLLMAWYELAEESDQVWNKDKLLYSKLKTSKNIIIEYDESRRVKLITKLVTNLES